MTPDEYNHIQRYCHKFLVLSLHGRHLEDLVQYVAMKYWESEKKAHWKWLAIDYCRINGITNNRGKAGAKTLEMSLSIDAPSPCEGSVDSHYLLDKESALRSDRDIERESQDDNFRGALEIFLAPFGFKPETMIWVTKTYKVKTAEKLARKLKVAN